MTPGKLEFISPNSWVTSLIRGVVASKFSRQAALNFRAFQRSYWLGLEINPKNVISCVGIKIEFSGCITNPRLSNKVMVSAMLLA